jgi:hypothetical protein
MEMLPIVLMAPENIISPIIVALNEEVISDIRFLS